VRKPGFERILVAMSGGVDSSVAAALLREAGHDVTAVTLKLWGGESDSGCCSVADVEDARRVAAQLDVPHYVFNFTDDFEASVVTPYTAAYADGRTPNPCVECNRTMKFGRLLDRARAMGFDAVATGHHARVGRGGDGRPVLRRGADAAKDQSYVLYMLGEDDLAQVRLPVGELTKAEVRAHARRLGLRTADKRESMDVCFITKHGKEAFLGARIPRAPGEIVTTAGAVLGEHSGVDAFTIGQRRGLGVAVGERRFVVDVDAATRTVTLGEHDDLLRAELPVVDSTFTTAAPAPDEAVLVQVRAHGAPFTGRWRGDRIVCDEPQPRVAPGQVIALYRGDVLLGGGIAA
jgi:tRNA-uridine 2-sulfurtransferase